MGLMEMALPRLGKLLHEVSAVAGNISFERSDEKQLVAGLYFARVRRLSEGVADAVKREDATSGFVLLRSLMEAYIDLRNIAADPYYVNHLIASDLDQQIKFLNTSGSNQSALNEKISELKQLKGRKFKPLSVKERFERAGEREAYLGKYWYLCRHSHNSLGIVEEGHLDISRLQIDVFAKLSDVDAELLIDTVAGIVANAVAEVKRLQEGGPPTGLDRVTNALNELRELWRPGPDEDNAQVLEPLSSSM